MYILEDQSICQQLNIYISFISSLSIQEFRLSHSKLITKCIINSSVDLHVVQYQVANSYVTIHARMIVNMEFPKMLRQQSWLNMYT